jgi:hypothetical protein
MTWIFLSPAASRMTSNSSCSAAASGPRHRRHHPAAADGDRGGGGDAEGVLELLHELAELDQRHLLERVKELVGAELRHGGVSF